MAGADADAKTGLHDRSALWFAAYFNEKDVVDALLLHDVVVDSLDAEGASPLFVACQEGHTRLVHTLIKAGAEPNLVTHLNNTALIIAAAHGHLTIIETLLDAGMPLYISLGTADKRWVVVVVFRSVGVCEE